MICMECFEGDVFVCVTVVSGKLCTSVRKGTATIRSAHIRFSPQSSFEPFIADEIMQYAYLSSGSL